MIPDPNYHVRKVALYVVTSKTLIWKTNGFIKKRVQRKNDLSYVLKQSKMDTKNDVQTRGYGQRTHIPDIFGQWLDKHRVTNM